MAEAHPGIRAQVARCRDGRFRRDQPGTGADQGGSGGAGPAHIWAHKSGKWLLSAGRDEVIKLCAAFQAAYPKAVRCIDFGTTPEGRPMKALATSAGRLGDQDLRAHRPTTPSAIRSIQSSPTSESTTAASVTRRPMPQTATPCLAPSNRDIRPATYPPV